MPDRGVPRKENPAGRDRRGFEFRDYVRASCPSAAPPSERAEAGQGQQSEQSGTRLRDGGGVCNEIHVKDPVLTGEYQV